MATRRVFFAIIASAEITAGGEGIAMSDKQPNNYGDKKISLNFPPRRGERFPPMWGFIPHVRGRFRSNAYREAFRWKLIRLATFFSTRQPVKYPQKFTFISQYQ